MNFMEKERITLVAAAYLVLMKDSKILLLRRFNTGYEDGNYSMIAGHLNGDETFIECIIREAKEEASINLIPDDLKVVHTMHRKATDHERIDIFIEAKKWKGELKIMETNKCGDLRWFDISSLPENVIPYVRRAIECISKGIFYSEHGWAGKS